MVSYEIPLVLSAVIVVMMVGSLNAAVIADAQTGFNWFVFSPWGFAAFIIFFIAALAETNRSPFDLPEAESEIIAGYFTEYSGFKFALFFLGEYIAMFAISGLAVTLFLGGGDGPGVTMNLVDQGLATEAFPGLTVIWFLMKIFALIAVMIWLRGTLPRLRVDQLMGFAWKFMLPLSILNIFIAGSALHLMAGDRLADLDETQPVLRQLMEGANLPVVAGLWIGALLILYVAAKGLNQLNRPNVRPREYKYAE
jgi:NADH-quinone oxidoreductase subunit H